MANGLTLTQFIETPLIHELNNIVNGASAARYLAFGQIAAGIKFLGACLDEKDWHQNSESENRFRGASSTLMAKVDKRYGGNHRQYDLYSQLRGGMAHVLRPKGDFSFIGKGTADGKGLKHLKVNHATGKMILVAEDFFDDFRSACNMVMQSLPTLAGSSDAKRRKLQGIFLPVSY